MTEYQATRSPITLLIADDTHFYRRGVEAELLVFADQIEIVGSAAAVDETLVLAQELAPQVLLLDLGMPKRRGVTARTWENGIAAIEQLVVLVPSTRILVSSMHEEAEIFFQALSAGAHGYLAKSDQSEGSELVQAIQRVASGEVIFSPAIAQLIRTTAPKRTANGATAPASRPFDPLALTPKEQQVLALLAAGKSNPEIADELAIKLPTVKTHVSNILGKLHLKRREEIYWKMRTSNADDERPS